MVGIFQDVKLEWEGNSYTIKSDRVMGAIAVIEEHVTMKELFESTQNRGTLKLATMSFAYGALLRYAGASVSDEQVYQSMFVAGKSRDTMLAMITGLMTLMIPPKEITERIAATEGLPLGNLQDAAISSSRKRTKRGSASGR